ncbi:MAG: F0F1 ATP synthase subunit epsilon [Patescibacteria group bacterium]
MIVHIYSLRKPVYEQESRSVNLKTISGEITILDDHRPLIAPLATGNIRVIDTQGKEEVVESKSGFVEVRPGGEVNILLK